MSLDLLYTIIKSLSCLIKVILLFIQSLDVELIEEVVGASVVTGVEFL